MCRSSWLMTFSSRRGSFLFLFFEGEKKKEEEEGTSLDGWTRIVGFKFPEDKSCVVVVIFCHAERDAHTHTENGH